MPTDAPSRFLEAGGGGVGALALRLLSKCVLSTGAGIDFASSAVRVAQKVLRASRMEVIEGDIRDLSHFNDSSFDHIVSFGVLCYLGSIVNRVVALSEMVRVLKWGLNVFQHAGTKHRVIGHV